MNGRKTYPLTLGELETEIKKAIAKYGKERFVLLFDDEEGNGVHECYFSFGDAKEFDYCDFPYGLKMEDCVVLG